MARVALGAREGVYVLIVELALLAGHVQLSPYWPAEIRRLRGELALVGFFYKVFLHASLLSVNSHII